MQNSWSNIGKSRSLLFVGIICSFILSFIFTDSFYETGSESYRTLKAKCHIKGCFQNNPFLFPTQGNVKEQSYVTCTGFSGLHRWDFSFSSKVWVAETIYLRREMDTDKATWGRPPRMWPVTAQHTHSSIKRWPCWHTIITFPFKFGTPRGGFFYSLIEEWILMLKSTKLAISILGMNWNKHSYRCLPWYNPNAYQ